jgi:small subunit ribosomal protein S16
MLKLRLKRYGKKREPNYRIIVIESRTRRQARPLAELGFYNPRTKETVLETGDILNWLRRGAQPTETLEAILRKAGVFEMLKANKSAGDDGVTTIRLSPVARVAAIVDDEAQHTGEPSGAETGETAVSLDEEVAASGLDQREPAEVSPAAEATVSPEVEEMSTPAELTSEAEAAPTETAQEETPAAAVESEPVTSEPS